MSLDAQLPTRITPPHYPSPAAERADLVVHVVGLTLAAVGGGVMLTLAGLEQSPGKIAGVAVYAVGLVCMLAFSTAYNFGAPKNRPTLRRLDHAGIFLMIAGSYTPFTTQSLTGGWAWGMTAAVWSLASFGAFGKLFLTGLDKRLWVIIYLALGWMGVVAVKPMLDRTTWIALLLLLLGGLLYSTGVIFYLNKRLKFARAIWHGHVVAAAGAHWTAILLGVVLASRV
jgi:hemolysin III